MVITSPIVAWNTNYVLLKSEIEQGRKYSIRYMVI